MAYGAVDVGTSVYGLARKMLKPDSWRLFSYVHYVRRYTEASKIALLAESWANTQTIRSMHLEVKEHGR